MEMELDYPRLKQQKWCPEHKRWYDIPPGSIVPGDIFRTLPLDVDYSFSFNPSPFRVLDPTLGKDGVLYFTFERVGSDVWGR